MAKSEKEKKVESKALIMNKNGQRKMMQMEREIQCKYEKDTIVRGVGPSIGQANNKMKRSDRGLNPVGNALKQIEQPERGERVC